MYGEEGFLHTIRDEYENEEPRLIFADWLEDQGDNDRADLIRLQCQRATLPERDCNIPCLDAQINSLLSANIDRWTGSVPNSLMLKMERGLFHVKVALTKRGLPRDVAKWWREYQPWIASASISGKSSSLGRIIQNGFLDTVSRLNLEGSGFHNDEAFNYLLRLSRLKQLELTLESPLPEGNLAALEKLSGLTSLELSPEHMHPEEALPEFPYLHHLERLKLRLELRQETTERLLNLPFLRDLTIGVYGSATDSLEYLGEMKNLERLYFYYGDDPRTHVKHLAKVSSLRRFLISHILLAADTVESVSALEQIEELRLCPTERVGEDWMKHLQPLQELKSIDFSESSFIEQGNFEKLHGLTKLETVNLDRTNVRRLGLKALSKVHSLKRLFLARNQLSKRDMKYLPPLTQLESLDLSGSSVSDAAVSYLSQMKSLRWIDLRRTTVTAKKIDELREALPEAAIEHVPKKKSSS